MPKTATPRKPETVSRKLAETRAKSKNRSLSSLLGIGDNEKRLATDIASGLNDVAGRGTIAALLGLPADLGGLLWDGGAWVNNKIAGLERSTGLVPNKRDIPYSQGNPYLGAEDIGNRMEQAGLVSDVRRPKTELLASLISPAQAATAGYKAPQMARAGVKALDNLSAPRTMGRQQGAIENLWHGSPHTFDRFDLSKIGTGEGAQAYGHGAYLAESPDVAHGYQYSTQTPEILIKGDSWKGDQSGVYRNPDGMHEGYLDDVSYSAIRALTGSRPDKSLVEIAGDAERFLLRRGEPQANIDSVKKAILSGDISLVKNDGNIYQTRLAWPDAREATDPLSPDHFLHWDKTLSGQPQAVQDRLRPFLSQFDTVEDGERYAYVDDYDYMDEIYRKLSGKYIGDDLASAELAKQGIPGIRYLDGGSRGAGAGSHNYVVFDDKLIDIVSRNGQPVGNLGKMVAPQDEALRVAQANAAKPVSEGGLGLRPDNTPEERAAAMGFDVNTPMYHGGHKNIDELKVNYQDDGSNTYDAGVFLTDSPLIAETYIPSPNGDATPNIMPLLVNRDNLLNVNANGRRWDNLDMGKMTHNRKSLADLIPADSEHYGATTTNDISRLASDLGFNGASIRNVKDAGTNSHVFRVKEYLQNKYGIENTNDPMYWQGIDQKKVDEARRAVEKMYDQKAETLAMHKTSNIRSRFAAFDPLRKDSSDLMAGVAPFGAIPWLQDEQ